MRIRTANDPTAPLSQERYMSSREFAELKGVSAIAVAARAAIVPNVEKRKLIWWLQAMSLADGGLRRLADELLAMFPERLGTKTMHALGIRAGRTYSGKALNDIRYELGHDYEFRKTEDTESGDKLISECRHLAKEGFRSETLYSARRRVPSLEEFLIDLCINPRLQIRTASEKDETDEIESDLARERFRELAQNEFKTTRVPYFNDIIGALIQYKARREREAKETFVHTTISRKVWETLDFSISARRMVLIDGLEGRGKTEAVKAWCELHLGQVRFVSLKGITNRTNFFREVAKALGIPTSYSYQAAQLQCRIEDVLKVSKLGLVVDEAHFAFAQGDRIRNRPEIMDWIDTGIANLKLPIALVTTPQFLVCLARAIKQAGWNYRQFRRRLGRDVKLPEKNTPQDIDAVVRAVLPGAPNSAVKQVLAYVHLTKRDLSAVGDVVDEIKALQGRDTLTRVTYEEIVRVIDEHLVPSEKNFVESVRDAEAKVSPRGSKRSRPVAIEPETGAASEEAVSESESRETPERLETGNRIASDRSAGAPRFEDNLITA